MQFPVIPKPPTSGDQREMYRWHYLICEVLNGLRSIWIEHNNTQNVYPVNLADSDTSQDKHISNAQGKKWEDHINIIDGNPHGTDHFQLDNIEQSDDSSASVNGGKHVTNAQVKKYEDHRLTTGNPHNTKTIDLDDVNSTPANADGQLLIWDDSAEQWNPSSNITINDTTRTIDTNTADLHIACGTDKTLILDETVWLDVDFPIIARTPAANQPTPAALIGNITAPTWAVNDYSICEGQELVHLWKEGTECHWHIHLITNGLDATDRYVRFEVEYTWATPGGVLQAATTINSGEILIPANTADRTHQLISIGVFTPAAAKIGTQVYARLKRVAAVGTAPTNNPFVTMLQLHIEVDTMGSRLIGTK